MHKFVYLMLLLCFLILFSCFSISFFLSLFEFVVVICLLYRFVFFRDILLNTYANESVMFSDLTMILVNLVENLNYKGIRQSGWISLGETLHSKAELVLLSVAVTEWFPFGRAV